VGREEAGGGGARGSKRRCCRGDGDGLDVIEDEHIPLIEALMPGFIRNILHILVV
jgi:hypothetical protein